MTDESWHVVRNIRGVTGFVGPGSKPVPLSDEEAEAIISESRTSQKESTLKVGDAVDIVEGIFADYSGRLDEISPDGNEVTVIVSTVGRDHADQARYEADQKRKGRLIFGMPPRKTAFVGGGKFFIPPS